MVWTVREWGKGANMVYLEVSALIEGLWRPKDGHFPLKQVVFIDEFDSKAFDRFFL
jgi:hypothetical protein